MEYSKTKETLMMNLKTFKHKKEGHIYIPKLVKIEIERIRRPFRIKIVMIQNNHRVNQVPVMVRSTEFGWKLRNQGN